MENKDLLIDNNLENLYVKAMGYFRAYIKIPLDSVAYVTIFMGLDKVENPSEDTTAAVCEEFVRDILADIYSVWEFENSIIPIS